MEHHNLMNCEASTLLRSPIFVKFYFYSRSSHAFIPAVRTTLTTPIITMTIPEITNRDVHMNPGRYSDPGEFWPERFESFPLSSSGYIRQHGAARDHFTFGAGRRSVRSIPLSL